MIEDLFEDFIKHYKLPVQKIPDKTYIEYVSKLLGFFDKWENFCSRVSERFEGSREKYRENYNKTKDKFLDYVKSFPEYTNFIEQDMSKFSIQKPKDLMSDIYNHASRGRYFMSVDLKKANFQALKYCGFFKDIDSWEDLMKKFTDLPELIESKYLRSVLCGQLNPARQILIEYWLIWNKIYPLIKNEEFKLVSLLNDEVIFEIPEKYMESDCKDIEKHILGESGLLVTVECFKLRELYLKSDKSRREFHFYMKNNDSIHCLNNKLYLIAWKLLKGKEPEEFDYWVFQDDIISQYLEKFTLYEL